MCGLAYGVTADQARIAIASVARAKLAPQLANGFHPVGKDVRVDVRNHEGSTAPSTAFHQCSFPVSTDGGPAVDTLRRPMALYAVVGEVAPGAGVILLTKGWGSYGGAMQVFAKQKGRFSGVRVISIPVVGDIMHTVCKA